MHDLTNPIMQAVDHEQLLRAALHDQVDGLEPSDHLPTIRARGSRTGVWAFALVATIGVLLILAGLLILATRGDTPPTPTISLLEA